MLCINNRNTDVYFNLAAEEYLLKNSRENIFMLWQSEPSVVIGKHQDIYAEVNTDFSGENQIKIARRFSGGGAVYHDLGNFNLTFIETNPGVNFDEFTHRMIRMLSSLGVEASADERRGLTIGGLKISGSAQSIHKDRVLFHATLLFSSDLKRLTTCLEGKPVKNKPAISRKVAVKSVKSPVTNLAEHLSDSISMEDVRNHIISYFTDIESDNKPHKLSENDIHSIENLKNIKYKTESWIFEGKFLKK